MIRRLELENFMSHAHTVVEFSPGVTVVIGPNNCGKSAVVEAIRCALENESGNYFIRHGFGECLVRLDFQDDPDSTRIEWRSKRKGGAVYRINGEDYSRLGRQTPDGFDKVHRLGEVEGISVHIGDQKSPMFLINESPADVARFFGSGTDIRLLLRMQELLAQEKKERNTRRRQAESERERLVRRLAHLESVPALEIRHRELLTTFHDLERRRVKAQRLRDWLPRHDQQADTVELQSARLAVLVRLSPPPVMRDSAPYRRMVERMAECAVQIERTRQIRQALRLLAPPPSLRETAKLRELVREIPRGERAVAKKLDRLRALARISEPPRLRPTEAAEALRDRLADAQSRHACARERVTVLQRLSPPPSLADPKLLRQWIERLGQAQQAAESAQKRLAELERQLEASFEALSAAVAQNPTCPLCGGRLNPAQLVGRGPEA